MRALPLALVLSACAVPPSGDPEPQASQRPSGRSMPSIERLDRAVHVSVNEARDDHALSALAWSGELAAVALGHSHDMALRQYFAHTDAAGRSVTDRLDDAEIDCATHGENLYQTSRWETVTYAADRALYDWFTRDEIAQRTVAGWLGSPGHRRNLLNDAFTRQGIGVAVDADDRVYVTQVLC